MLDKKLIVATAHGLYFGVMTLIVDFTIANAMGFNARQMMHDLISSGLSFLLAFTVSIMILVKKEEAEVSFGNQKN